MIDKYNIPANYETMTRAELIDELKVYEAKINEIKLEIRDDALIKTKAYIESIKKAHDMQKLEHAIELAKNAFNEYCAEMTTRGQIYKGLPGLIREIFYKQPYYKKLEFNINYHAEKLQKYLAERRKNLDD